MKMKNKKHKSLIACICLLMMVLMLSTGCEQDKLSDNSKETLNVVGDDVSNPQLPQVHPQGEAKPIEPEVVEVMSISDFETVDISEFKQRYITLGFYMSVNDEINQETFDAISEIKLRYNDELPENQIKKSTIDAFMKETDEKFADVSDDYLMLTNKNLSLRYDYEPENKRKVEVLANRETFLEGNSAQAVEDMFAKAKTDGIKLVLASGYRDFGYQQGLFDRKVDKIGFEEANKIVAKPGESEHQTGYVVDITCDSVDWTLVTRFDETKEFDWLQENAPDFGFILRYPEEKVDVTKYSYEPWHYRYIGDPEIANFIMDNDLTLEEYHENHLN